MPRVDWNSFWWAIPVMFYIGWIVVNIMLANQKNRNVLAAFIVSILFTPLLGYLYIAASSALPEKPAAPVKL